MCQSIKKEFIQVFEINLALFFHTQIKISKHDTFSADMNEHETKNI
jgi:hypothetical protein